MAMWLSRRRDNYSLADILVDWAVDRYFCGTRTVVISHTFASIPSYVQDDILKKFFDTHEPQTLGEIIGEAILGPCGLAISPRIGQKLKQCRE